MSAQLQHEARDGAHRTEQEFGPSTETTPLLGDIQYPSLDLSITVVRTTDAPSPVEAGALAVQTHIWKWRAVYLCGLFAFLVSFASFMTEGPRMTMLHYAVFRDCKAHHPWDHQGDSCKDSNVSWRVGEVRGHLAMLENILGLALAVPYGMLADATSRKLVLALGLVGLILRDYFFFSFLYYRQTFPLQIVYLAPLFVAIGGGPIILSATVLSIVAAASPEEYRTQSFLYLSVAILLSEMLSRPVGSYLLDRLDLYTASVVAMPILCLGFLIITIIPSRQWGSTDSEGGEDRSTAPQDPGGLGARIWQKVENMPAFIRDDIGPVLGDSTLAIGLIALVFQKLARPFLDLMLEDGGLELYWPASDVRFIPSIAAIPLRRSQWMSDKQKSELEFIMSVQAAVQIVLFLLVLPWVYRGLLQKWNNHPGRANLALGRLCVSFLAIGSLFMGMGLSLLTTVIIYTCGTGFAIAMRLFLTSLVREHHITTLFTTMALIEGVASLLVSPLVELTLDSGGKIGGLHMRLPLLVAAALYTVAGIMVWNIRAKLDDQPTTVEERLRSDSDGMDHNGDGTECPPAYSA